MRALADSLAIELPTHRDLKSSKRVRAQASGLGAEAGWEEGRRVEGHIHLNMLAIQLKQKVSNREIVDGLGQIPIVNDRGILSTALAHVQNMPNDVAAGALSERLQSAYESERAREVARAKRDELSQVAIQNQMVVLRGTFRTETDERGATCVSLTHLEPAEVANESTDPDAEGLNIEEEMPMPEDVGIRAVLPSENALTTAGRERLGRGAPFYGRLIGHSASMDEAGSVLTCSAYAVWGMPRPDRLLERPRPYEFLERQ